MANSTPTREEIEAFNAAYRARQAEDPRVTYNPAPKVFVSKDTGVSPAHYTTPPKIHPKERNQGQSEESFIKVSQASAGGKKLTKKLIKKVGTFAGVKEVHGTTGGNKSSVRGKSRPPSKPLVVRAKNNLGNYRLRLASYTAATNARGISRPDINRSTLTVKTTSNAAVASALSKATYAFEKHLETSSNLFLKQTKKRLTEETRESLKAGHLDAIKGGKGSLGIMNGLNRLVDTHKNAYISYVHSLSGVLEKGLNVHPNGSASNKVTASVLGQQITAYGAFHKLTEYTMDAKKALGTQRLWKHTGELATAFKASVSAQNLNKQSFFDASSVKSSEDSVTFKLSIPEWKDPNARAQAFVNEIIPKAYKGGFEGIREADSTLTHAVRQFADKIKSEKLVSNKALGISGTSFKHLLKKGKRK